MAATEIWIHALKLYGPAPALPVLHRTNRAPTVDAFFDPRRREEARTALAARQAHRSNIVKRRQRTSSVTQRAITCPQCEHGLDPSDDAIHCDSCRSFIIRYTMHERGDRRRSSDLLNVQLKMDAIAEEADEMGRPRSSSV
eukprot:m.72683 g.72683  ORF g.72683 m.72683 type:complete len:141 (-) comp14276_c0_seq3:198-620(-)